MLIAMLITSVGVNAQNVTIKKSTGAAIASVPEGDTEYDTFFKEGGFATWRHNQLNLTMTTSDYTDLTENGQLANPANNICESTTADALCLGKGNGTTDFPDIQTYVTIALPKGYSFTGYEIVWSRNLANFGTGTGSYTNGNAIFGETDPSFNYKTGYYNSCAYSSSAPNMTITREDPNMGNVLYFRLSSENNDNKRVAITLKSVTLYFTAEADYSPLVPADLITSPVSAVDVPFPTGKVDYGSIESRHYNGEDRVSYSSANVTDLPANFTLYEYESTENGTHFDGTSGKVVKYQAGTISSEGSYFKAGRAAAEGQTSPTEQVYIIESPTYVTLPDANDTKNPVGFRIVGAKIDYSYGTAHNAGQQEVEVPHYTSYPTFYISGSAETYTISIGWTGWQYTSQGTKYYYMKSDASMTNNEAQKTLWFIDNEGYIRNASNPNKYLKNTNNGMEVVTLSDRPAKYSINDDGQITLQTSPNMYLCLSVTYYRRTNYIESVNNFQMINNGSVKATRTPNGGSKTITTYTTETVVVPAFTPSTFTLKVYDREGGTNANLGYQEIEVTSTTKDGSLFIGNLNNDAIKIGLVGVGLFKGTITLQALDPYIDRMSVVCNDNTKLNDDGDPIIRIAQTFTADDFSVSGGEFWFYLPGDCVNDQVTITYEDLWSRYADETYEGQTEMGHNSRFNFVNSAHNNAFTSDNIYNNIAEAKAGKDVVLERQKVTSVGNIRFKFNNADQVGTNGGTLTEYPFTKARYAAQTGKNYLNQTVNGDFYNMNYTVSTADQSQTAYVFTTDETRYNIAPTTAVQHRAYAFYEMIVHVTSKTYNPKVKIVKIYDSSCTEKNGQAVTVPYYGAVVTAPYTEGTGSHAVTKAGYASDKQIEEAIDRVILTDKKDDFNNSDVPADRSQILYVDLTGLAGYYTNTQATKTLTAYKNDYLGKNSLVFFPKGVTTEDDNFAYVTQGGGMRAANNIILTDKHPFYSPYDIQVPSTNYAKYTRLVSGPGNVLAQYATIMMPFTLNVTDGLHKNETDDGCEFYIRTMKELQNPAGAGATTNNYYSTGNFVKVTGEKTEANKPYMVEVTKNNSSEYSFVASQKGSDIKATTAADPKKIPGETVRDYINSRSLTNYGTYSGVSVPKEQNIYYFNRNKYVSSLTLAETKPSVYVQPFRAYYATTTTTSSNSHGAKMLGFEIGYDLFSDNGGITTSLTETSQPKVMTINTGKGSMLIKATENIQVKIMSANGVNVDGFYMNAGEQKQVNLPAGIYIVNNTKIIVK